jgi:hypothetical protein
MAHYMPWYTAKPYSGEWGWHWTMNHFDPEKVKDGKREVASRFYPQIGPYDSADPDVLEYHVLLMKFSGLQGAIIDWYGYDNVYDYSTNHLNTLKMISWLRRAGLKFAICYEDQTLPNLIRFGKTTEADAVPYGRKLIEWMQKNWFSSPNYLRVAGKPALLVFGPQYYKPPQWQQMLQGIDLNVFGVMGPHGFDNGGFAWPAPKATYEMSQEEMNSFYKRAAGKLFIAGAYPRFKDIYGAAGVREPFPEIEDRNGHTFATTLSQALQSGSPVVQIATWNDWGEGTQIEPSVEHGTRDLEMLQARLPNPRRYTRADLQLPLRLYKLRKEGKQDEANQISRLLFAGKAKEARALLD